MKLSIKSILLLLTVVISSAAIARAEIADGQAFPNLATFGLIGDLPNSSGHVVLVDFWATWCAPCHASLPAYNKLQREFEKQGLTIIGVSVDDDSDRYLRFMEKLPLEFAAVRDAEHQLVKTVRPAAMPTCYLIDRNGIVQAVHTGFHGDSTLRQLRSEIIKLLEEKP